MLMAAPLLLGAIADDYTGGSDLAGMLAGEGVRTVQLFGIPSERLLGKIAEKYTAAVVCLKSRSIDPEPAVELSLCALGALQGLGARQIQFKYCSTFDSTARGNIGPVAEALLDAMGERLTIAVPALPVNGRTQYLGCLFVNGVLLSRSPMRTHPLNPMTEPDLLRHLQPQLRGKAGLVTLAEVRKGPTGIRAALARLEQGGVRVALADAIEDSDLDLIAQAVADEKLITGGSGIGQKLPRVWESRGLWTRQAGEPRESRGQARGVLVIAGSCSDATLAQLDCWRAAGLSAESLDVERLIGGGEEEIGRIAAWARERLHSHGRALVFSSARAETRARILDRLSAAGHTAGDVRMSIEAALAAIARSLATEHGLRGIVVAGGETSGAVLDALGVQAVEILDTLDPGVPALQTLGEQPLGLALKSGNFGSEDFFEKAVRYLEAA
jgi:uncharacterized protein YgbK (DUF1537 family)